MEKMLLPSQTVDLMSPTPYTDATKVSLVVFVLKLFSGVKDAQSLDAVSGSLGRDLLMFNHALYFFSVKYTY